VKSLQESNFLAQAQHLSNAEEVEKESKKVELLNDLLVNKILAENKELKESLESTRRREEKLKAQFQDINGLHQSEVLLFKEEMESIKDSYEFKLKSCQNSFLVEIENLKANVKGSLDYEEKNNLKLDDEFVKVSREIKLSNALSQKSVHDKKPSLSQDSCTLKRQLETGVTRVLNYDGEDNFRIEGCTLEREDIVNKEKLKSQEVTITLLKECSWKTQMLNKKLARELSLNKKEVDTLRNELVSKEEMHYVKSIEFREEIKKLTALFTTGEYDEEKHEEAFEETQSTVSSDSLTSSCIWLKPQLGKINRSKKERYKSKLKSLRHASAKEFTCIKKDIISLEMKFQGHCEKNSNDTKQTPRSDVDRKEIDHERHCFREEDFLDALSHFS